ncbi:hypothetical protein ACJX0J_022167, partial [Zea mays]
MNLALHKLHHLKIVIDCSLDNANISQQDGVIRFPLSFILSSSQSLVLTQMAEYYTKQSEQGATVPVVENWRSCIGNWPYNSAGSCLARQPLSPCLTPFKMFCYVDKNTNYLYNRYIQQILLVG